MKTIKLIHSEILKVRTTILPWSFLAVILLISILNAAGVIWGTDMDGSKTFVSTAIDQQSLISFAINSMMLAGLFGAIAIARDYGSSSIIPTFLVSPKRKKTIISQVLAMAIAGAMVGLLGVLLVTVAVVISLTTTDFSFMVPAVDFAQVVATSMTLGAAGAMIGAGFGAITRNVGAAVSGIVVIFVFAPGLITQLISSSQNWMPGALANTLSGVESASSIVGAIVATCVWVAIPIIGWFMVVGRRDLA